MSDVGTSLAAGAIGSLITIGVALIARASSVPREMITNDRRASDRDTDLGTWLADRNVRLLRELEAARRELAARSALYSGDYGYRLGLLKEAALHEWRDQVRLAERDVAAIYDHEGWTHTAWRSLKRRPRHTLAAPFDAHAVLSAWQTPLRKHLSAGDEPQPIDDPSKRTLQSASTDAMTRITDYE